MAVKIIELEQVNEGVVAAFARLIPQLTDIVPPGREALEAVLASPACTIFLAVDSAQADKIIGTLTLAVFRTPTALHAWIEDVVVDMEYRGRGIGEALTRAGMNRAAALGAKHVDLTSRPQRESANRLYRRMGFQQRATNLYRLKLD